MKKIAVTRPLLPPLEDLQPYLEEIWASGWLTNGGPMHARLERELAAHLGVEHLSLFSNGTLALILGLRALGITRGEIVTTPFTFVATTQAITWAGAEPVFADIDPETLNIDPERLAAAITPRTRAIMPVHVYGRACPVGPIAEIARAHGIPVIYDAAHAFGIRHQGKSLLRHGHMSMLSFHATKVFSTVEGGAMVCRDAKTKARLDRLRNFGIVDETTIPELGLNAKMNEVQAAFGLVALRHVDAAIARRRDIDAFYRRLLDDVRGIAIPSRLANDDHNASYFPILVDDDHPLGRDGLQTLLHEHDIQARRYFFPLTSALSGYCGLPSADPARLPVATEIARRVLCLPIHADLTDDQVERIADLVAGSARAA